MIEFIWIENKYLKNPQKIAYYALFADFKDENSHIRRLCKLKPIDGSIDKYEITLCVTFGNEEIKPVIIYADNVDNAKKKAKNIVTETLVKKQNEIYALITALSEVPTVLPVGTKIYSICETFGRELEYIITDIHINLATQSGAYDLTYTATCYEEGAEGFEELIDEIEFTDEDVNDFVTLQPTGRYEA